MKHSYGKGCDVFLEQRHRFVRKMQNPHAVDGPYTAEPKRNASDIVVAAVCGAIAAAALVRWALPYIMNWIGW